MTREEAREILWRYDVNFEPHPPEEVMHAIDMAIEALSADTVSRGAHYDAVANRITDMEERGFVSVVRCKDCRHWDREDEYCTDGEGLCGGITEDDYCSRAVRREP